VICAQQSVLALNCRNYSLQYKKAPSGSLCNVYVDCHRALAQIIWHCSILSFILKNVAVIRITKFVLIGDFLVNGTAVWNSLSVALRSPDTSLDIFKDKLKTFLFRTVY